MPISEHRSALSQMPRIPLQVLVLPFRQSTDGMIEYAIFRRNDHGDDCWQGLAGGAEAGESAEQAAQREAKEEASIPYISLRCNFLAFAFGMSIGISSSAASLRSPLTSN